MWSGFQMLFKQKPKYEPVNENVNLHNMIYRNKENRNFYLKCVNCKKMILIGDKLKVKSVFCDCTKSYALRTIGAGEHYYISIY